MLLQNTPSLYTNLTLCAAATMCTTALTCLSGTRTTEALSTFIPTYTHIKTHRQKQPETANTEKECDHRPGDALVAARGLHLVWRWTGVVSPLSATGYGLTNRSQSWGGRTPTLCTLTQHQCGFATEGTSWPVTSVTIKPVRRNVLR